MGITIILKEFDMPKTVVGLFEDPGVVDEVVHEIEARGFPRRQVQALEEPAAFDVTGVMSFPRLDFELDLVRELTRIGATEAESQAYLAGLRRGGALVFATALDDQVKAAAEIMNRRGAMEVAETRGPKPELGRMTREQGAKEVEKPSGNSVVFTW